MLKKLGFGFLVSLTLLLVASCQTSERELSPGNFAGFSLPEYMDVSTKIELDGILDDYTINGVILNKTLAHGTDSLRIHIVKFDKAGQASSFWYSWAGERASDLEAIFSAIPWVYGEIKGEHNSSYFSAWFSGQWFYLFEGDKATVDSAVKVFKDYRKIVVKSIES